MPPVSRLAIGTWVLLAPALAAQQLAPPARVRYLTRVTSEETDAKGRTAAEPEILVRTVVHGDSARADYLQPGKAARPGDYLLTTDGGRTILEVSPGRRRYRRLVLAEMNARIAADAGARLTPTGWAAADSGVREGTPWMGHRTEHRTLVRQSRFTAKSLVFKVGVQLDETAEWETSAAQAAVPDPFGELARAEANAFFVLDSAAARATREALAPWQGRLVLRWQSVIRSDEGGKRSTATTRLQVEALEAVEPEPGLFVLPAGYRLDDR